MRKEENIETNKHTQVVNVYSYEMCTLEREKKQLMDRGSARK